MPVETPATELRLLRQGDSWTYMVSGSLAPPGGVGMALSGRIVVTITMAALPAMAPGPAISFAQELRVATPDGGSAPFPAPPLMFWFTQDQQSRDLFIHADTMTPDGTPRRAAEGRLFYPGTWSGTTAYDNVLDFGADKVRNTLTIQRAEVVETPMGAFAAWFGPITSESPVTGLITGADWWTPSLGAPIQFETRSTLPDGAVMTMRAQMTATNVL